MAQTGNVAAGCLAVLAAASITYAASLSNSDKQFMMTAARMDMTEAHAGQMAENQAARTDVKNLGKTLDQDHTASYEDLTKLAEQDGVSLPKGINAAKDPTIGQLVRLKGDHFDRRFVRDQTAAERRELAVFQREAKHGSNADLKVYAGKMVQTLQKDLRLTEECAKPAI